MSRLPFLTAEDIAADQPNIIRRLEREHGTVPNVYRVLAHARVCCTIR